MDENDSQNNNTFVVPEEPEKPDEKEETEISGHKKNKIDLKKIIRQFFANPKKRLIFIIAVGLVIIALFAYGLYSLSRDKSSDQNPPKENNTENNAPKVFVQAPLDGIMTDQEAANRHPLAVVIENHPDARPQAGLEQASIVYEAIAEGGITRFMTIFGTKSTDKVGPVRSARTFFIDWARGYDAYIAHVGGNIDALDQIKAEKVLDLDQFVYPNSYWRERSSGLATEHTMYASLPKLWEQASNNKYPTANNFNVFKFKDDDAQELLPASQKVNIDFSNNSYNVVFNYDKTINSYKRVLSGSTHIDQISKNQLAPKNLIVMTVSRKPVVTRINESGWEMITVGNGNAKIFVDGKVINGKWKKASKTDRELFYDQSDNEIVFNRGQFWIAVIPPEVAVTVE